MEQKFGFLLPVSNSKDTTLKSWSNYSAAYESIEQKFGFLLPCLLLLIKKLCQTSSKMLKICQKECKDSFLRMLHKFCSSGYPC
jgi:hypothetical protein